MFTVKTVTLGLLATSFALAPPSGRPPMGPLKREDPKAYDVSFEIALSTEPPINMHEPGSPPPPNNPRQPYRIDWGVPFELKDAPITMPIILQGAYSRVDPDSLNAELWLSNRPDKTINERSRLDEGLPHHAHLAVMPITQFTGKTIRWRLTFRTEAFSSRIDEKAAAKIAWPREWPKEVADGLTPQMFIESGDPFFANAVKNVSEGQLRMVPPYLAAKDLVRYSVVNIQTSGDSMNYGRLGVLHGMDIQGALKTAKSGRGEPIDLVCVCVAMLKAAGIPARPVIGVHEDEDDQRREKFSIWAEFYLPDAGWVPFDPNIMRGQSLQNRDIRQLWKGFGTLDELNERIPLSYHFMPPKQVESPQNPAVWGWDPRPGRAPGAEQQVRFSIVSRGKGTPDPE